MDLLIQVAGWVGMALVLGAYLLLVTSDKIDENSRAYQFMNIAGAIGLGINAYYSEAWPLVALNIAWLLIAIDSLIRKRR